MEGPKFTVLLFIHHIESSEVCPLPNLSFLLTIQTKALISLNIIMLTLNTGSVCDVCSEDYGPHCRPHSIPCGKIFFLASTRVFLSDFFQHRSCTLRQLLRFYRRKDSSSTLARLPVLSRTVHQRLRSFDSD